MPISCFPLPFINTSMMNTGKPDPSKVALSTTIDYVTKRNGARNMRTVQIHSLPICFPQNFPSALRFTQNDINEKRHTLASASKNQEEMNNKMKEHILPKLQPRLSMTMPIKNEQNAKKTRMKAQSSKAWLDDFRQNIKTVKSLMNPESSSKVVESDNEAADSRKGVRHEEFHIFSPFAGASCERAEKIKLMVTGNSYPKALVNIMNMEMKLTADNDQRHTFARNYF
ncbi:uncharacterized protein LOC110211068 [Phascolarctos cinereus]|uniref:Uncharacterized protein LOC110211068 n=1 Tax=Phascolarctos cinereus TaxID=38626 RepID=A0A6P5KLP6_PHACI|nr:uncharacterized protein LOC110211068 [Phascolarctos cinereus]